ncbi:MAG: PIN domain-containing protein [Acidimicrobiia bacterium]|nr:PIN domain-containing protein [Acidimicrobiia bacterium]
MIVVDSSVLVDALTMASGAEKIHTRIEAEDLHAPHLIDVEVVSSLRGMVLRNHLGAARATDALGDFDDLAITRWNMADPLRRRAFQLRDRLSAYDATFVALAESLQCPFLTRDRRLARAGGHDAAVEVL